MTFSVFRALRPTLIACAVLAQACSSGGGDGPAPTQTPNSAPSVVVEYPGTASITDQEKAVVRGTVADADGDAVTAIDITDAAGRNVASVVPVGGAWSAEVPLAAGNNVFSVAARDAAGSVGSTSVSIRQDVVAEGLSLPVYSAAQDAIFAVGRSVLPALFTAAFDPGDLNPAFPPDFFTGTPAYNIAFPAPPNLSPVIRLDPVTGARRVVSGAGIGAGPELPVPALMTLNPVDDSLIIYDASLNAFYRVDTATGDRSLLVDLSDISTETPGGAVVDLGRQRLLFNLGLDFWEFDLVAAALRLLTTVSAPDPAGLVSPGIALSGDGNFLYFYMAGEVIELNLLSLVTRALAIADQFVFDGTPPLPGGIIVDDALGRVVLLLSNLVLGIDLASGITQELIALEPEPGVLVSLQPGRLATELFVLEAGIDQLFTLDLLSGVRTLLGGSSVGAGPRLAGLGLSTALTIADGQAYLPQSFVDVGSPALGLLSVNLVNGNRARIDVPGLAADAATAFAFPGLLVDADSAGKLVLVSTINGLVVSRFDPVTNVLTTILDDSDAFPPLFPLVLPSVDLICVDKASNQLYFGDGREQRLERIDLATGLRTVLSSFDDAVGAGPDTGRLTGLACDTAGQRLVALSGQSVYAVDYATGDRSLVGEFDGGGGLLSFFAVGFALSSDGLTAYATLEPAEGISVMDLATGSSSLLSGDSAGVGFFPTNIRLIDDASALVVTFFGTLWRVDLESGARFIVSR